MITEYGIEAKSNSEIISELGGRFKQYRLFSNLTQKEVAVKAFSVEEHRIPAGSRETLAATANAP